MRVDLYTLVHKAQRFHLFKLASDLGNADFKNSVQTQSLAARIEHELAHLRDHARIEESYIHPLLAKVGQQAQLLEREHERLEQAIDALERCLRQGQWSELYGAFTHFLSQYLVHLEQEEAIQREVLWQHYDDAALGAVFQRFKSERAPQAARADLEMMLPALAIPELARMFSAMKANPPVFKNACELAAKVLGEEKWRELAARLAA